MKDVVAHVEPPLLVAGVLPPELGDLGAGFEQAAGVGAHALERTDAKFVMLRRSPEEATLHPVAARVLRMATDHHRRRTRTQGEGRKVLEQIHDRRVFGEQPLDGRLMDLAGAFAIDDKGVIDLASLNHRACDLNAVEKAQARVRNVEVHAGRRKPQQVVHGDRARRLEPLTAHARIDHQPDAASIDTRRRERLLARHRCRLHERHTLGPLAALADTGERLEQALGRSRALVERRQTLINLGRGYDLGRIARLDRHDGDVVETESGIPKHSRIFLSRPMNKRGYCPKRDLCCQ